MANISSIKAASLSMCFSVGAVLFSSHAGGGFATGNQENAVSYTHLTLPTTIGV